LKDTDLVNLTLLCPFVPSPKQSVLEPCSVQRKGGTQIILAEAKLYVTNQTKDENVGVPFVIIDCRRIGLMATNVHCATTWNKL
jgi:hypothetical protein